MSELENSGRKISEKKNIHKEKHANTNFESKNTCKDEKESLKEVERMHSSSVERHARFLILRIM